jgi:hypothetical protein
LKWLFLLWNHGGLRLHLVVRLRARVGGEPQVFRFELLILLGKKGVDGVEEERGSLRGTISGGRSPLLPLG